MTFEELLQRDGKIVYRTKGVSMRPMLHQNRDLVVIEKKRAGLRPFDVAFYKRGEKYVLHRVIKVRENDYLIRGDNTYRMEIVPEEAVLGVLREFNRKGKVISVTDPGYRLYSRVWTVLYPLRYVRVKITGRLKRIARKLGITPVLKRWLRHE